MIKVLIFDWGDTIMRDYALDGPMCNWEKVDWIPGVERLLENLSPDFKIIIATSADHSGTDDMKKALDRINATKYFDLFFSQKELGYKKPDPRFFDAVLKKSDFVPDEAVMIGNSYEKDIVGAKTVGMKTIFFNEGNLEGDFSKADLLVNEMSDISKKSIESL